jgi:hypothetical protein
MRVILLLCLTLTGCATYNIDQSVRVNISVDTPVGTFPLVIRDPHNPYRKEK